MSITNYNEANSQFEDNQQLLDKQNQNEETECLDSEQIIELVGGWGLYQKTYTFIFSIMWMMEAAVYLSPPIMYQHVHLKCYDSTTNTYYKCDENSGGCQQKVIQVYDNSYTTMTSQFQLYCDKKYIRQYGSISVYIGAVIAGFVLAPLADRKGRCKLLVVLQFVYSFLSILTPLIDNIYFQIVNNAMIQGMVFSCNVAHFAFINESSETQARSFSIAVICLALPIGSIIYTYLFEILKDWKTTNFISITIPALLCNVQSLFLQETPFYLFQKQKQQELMQVIQKIAKMNGRSHLVKSNYKFKFVESNQEKQSQYTYSDLFRFPRLKTVIISCIFLQFVSQSIYTGLNFCLENVGFDIYFNTIVAQLGHLVGQVICLFIAAKVSRKSFIRISLLFGSLFNFAQLFIKLPEKESDSRTHLQIVQVFLIFMAKFAGCACQCLLYIYYPEVFPTEVRNQSSGLILAIGFISIALSPFIVDFADQLAVSPLVILSLVSFIGVAISYFLVETLNKPLLHTIEQFEESKE